MRWAHASSSWRTRAGARGSAKVAVPTWTALAPARISSAASPPVAMPPTPTIVRSGSAACTSWTARTAIGWMAGPERPPPREPDPSRYDPVSGSMARPRTVLTSVTASAPPARAASAMGTRSVTFGLSLAQRGRPHRAVASMASCVAAAEWANRSRAASVLGQERFTSTATTDAGASASKAAAASYSAMVRPQIEATIRAPVAASGGRSCAIHASTPGPCRPTLLIIPATVSCTRSAGLPSHGRGGQRLDHDGAEGSEVHVRSQLGAVAGRARRGHDRVREH